MTFSLKNLRTNHNFWGGAILFISVCIVSGVIFLHPKSLYQIFFVPVKVSVSNEAFQEIKNIKAFRLSPRNTVSVVYPVSDPRVAPIKKLILLIPKSDIEDFKQVRISLGKTHFLYTRRQFLQKWRKIDKHFNKEKTLIDYVSFEAPPEVKTDSICKKMEFAIPLAGSLINGNPETLKFIKECAVFFYVPVLFFILLIFLLIFVISSLKHAAFNKNTYLSMMLSGKYYNHQRRFGWAHMALVFISTFVVASFFSRLGIDIHHHGFMLQAAVNVSEGKMLFKDIYFHYGPLVALAQSLAIDIFGKRLIVIQIETAFFYALTSIFLWLIWSRFMRSIFATLSCFVWLCLAPYLQGIFLPWATVYALFFLTLSLYMSILALEKENLRYLYLTGVTVSLTFWSRQSEGILLFLSMLGFYFVLHILWKSDVKLTLKKIGLFLAGNITISVAFLAWLLMNGAIKDWWVQCFPGMVHWVSSCCSGSTKMVILKAIRVLFPGNFWIILPLLAFLALVSVISNIGNKRKIDKQAQVLLVILFVSLANWLNYFPTPSSRHFYWAATPLVGIFVFYLLSSWKLVEKLLKLKKIAFSFGLTLLMFLCIIVVTREIIKKMNSGIKRVINYRYEVTKPDILSGMMVTHESQVTALKKLDTTIQTYLTSFPGTSLISLSTVNILFLTLVDNNELFSPLPIVTESRILLETYKYKESLSKCIEQKKVMFFADEAKTLPGYQELAHISTVRTSPHDSGTWYLYVPIQTKTRNGL